MKNLKVYTAKEFVAAVAHGELKEPMTVEYDKEGTHIDIYDDTNKHNPYYVELATINTGADIIGWAIHLSEKNWMTAYAIGRFMQLAASAKKIIINR